MSNLYKRKNNEDDEGEEEGGGIVVRGEKKVRFREQQDVSTYPPSNDDEDQNEETIFEQRLKEQIKRGDEKQRKRDEEDLKRKKLFNEHRVRDIGKELVDNGVISRVEGEEDENDYDDMEISNNNNINSKFGPDGRKVANVRHNDDSDDSEDEVEIVPFNLRQEMDEGKFTEDGGYERGGVENEDDAWLQEYDQVWSNKVPKLSKKELKRQDDEDDGEIVDAWEKEEEEEKVKRRRGPTTEEKIAKRSALSNILEILLDGETVTSGIRRLGSSKSKSNNNNKKKNQQQQDSKDIKIDIEREEQRKKSFTKLTESVDFLLSCGHLNIYQDKKEQIQGYLDRENGKGPHQQQQQRQPITINNQSTTNDQQWEYKAIDGNIYGPFGTNDMREWKSGGYFTNQNVMCRRVGSDDQSFTLIDNITF